MNKKITVAIIGCGEFAKHFVPLFKNHPTVKKVYVCDLIKSKSRYLPYRRRFFRCFPVQSPQINLP